MSRVATGMLRIPQYIGIAAVLLLSDPTVVAQFRIPEEIGHISVSRTTEGPAASQRCAPPDASLERAVPTAPPSGRPLIRVSAYAAARWTLMQLSRELRKRKNVYRASRTRCPLRGVHTCTYPPLGARHACRHGHMAGPAVGSTLMLGNVRVYYTPR